MSKVSMAVLAIVLGTANISFAQYGGGVPSGMRFGDAPHISSGRTITVRTADGETAQPAQAADGDAIAIDPAAGPYVGGPCAGGACGGGGCLGGGCIDWKLVGWYAPWPVYGGGGWGRGCSNCGW